MELLEYQDPSTFTIKSSSESEEDYQIMNNYFSHGSDNDLSYTNELDYDSKTNQNQYIYGNTNNTTNSSINTNIDDQQSLNTNGQQIMEYQYFPQHPVPSGLVPQHFNQQSYQQQVPQHLPSFNQYSQHQPQHLLANQMTLNHQPPQLRTLVGGSTSGGALNSTPMATSTATLNSNSNLIHSSPILANFGDGERKRLVYSPPLQRKTGQSLPLNLQEYPDMTTMVNSNQSLVVPMVDTAFVDLRTCTICNKRINRDMTRHMRTHQVIPRFQCPFPRLECNHKSGRFNRPYDYKKHLLNRHFKFDNQAIRRLHTLSDKLDHAGVCPCGTRYIGRDWLDNHISTDDLSKRCPHIDPSQR